MKKISVYPMIELQVISLEERSKITVRFKLNFEALVFCKLQILCFI